MSSNPPGTPWQIWAVVILVAAMIPAGVTYYTFTENQRLEQAKLEQQKQRELEQRQQQERDQAVQRLEIHRERVKSVDTSASYAILVRNDCNKMISVAIIYKALDGKWVTQGWLTLEPNDKQLMGEKTQNRVFYLFAENRKEGLEWSGKEKFSNQQNISNKAFIRLEGDTLLHYDGSLVKKDDLRTVFFRSFEINNPYYGEYTQALSCKQ